LQDHVATEATLQNVTANVISSKLFQQNVIR